MQRHVESLNWLRDVPPAAEVRRVIDALAEGALVGLPTETVYGLAARADLPAAVARLAAIKGRDASQPLTWHVGNNEALARLPSLSAMARRLVTKYWPGPLTLVLPGVASGVECAAKNGWTGVRRPAHTATAALLSAAPFAVVATSANAHGHKPLVDASSVLARFGEDLAFVLDGGTPKLGEASVVLKLGPGAFDVLRPGILDLSALRATAGLRLGFVCTGNTCRSPMAEGLAAALIAHRLRVQVGELDQFGFTVTSMGVFASPGEPVSAHAVSTLREQGIDISEHRASLALAPRIAALDRVFALTRSHLEALSMLLAPGKDSHCELLDPAGRDIADPVGGSRADYERTALQIRRAIEARLDDWV